MSEQMKWTWDWKWALVIGGGILLLLYLDFSPNALQGIKRLIGQGSTVHPRRVKVSQAELMGKLDHALLYAAEVNERLLAYKGQFDCEDGQLLDSLFFEGVLSNHYLRPTWWELRRELPEFVRKHEALIGELHKARESVSRADSIEQWQDLPDEAEEATKALDTAIRDRNRKVRQFAALVNQIKLRQAIQERRGR